MHHIQGKVGVIWSTSFGCYCIWGLGSRVSRVGMLQGTRPTGYRSGPE